MAAANNNGNPLKPDPTANVRELNEASVKRQDDLRLAERMLTEAKLAHLKDVSELHSKYQKEINDTREKHSRDLATAESGRLNAIRQVDREEVIKTAASGQTAIGTLAASTTALAETLRNQQSAFAAEVNKRLSALELALSEGKGKQTLADPMMVEMVAEMKALRTADSTRSGFDAGKAAAMAAVGVAGGGAAALIMRMLQ
jgi:hypothetical protein